MSYCPETYNQYLWKHSITHYMTTRWVMVKLWIRQSLVFFASGHTWWKGQVDPPWTIWMESKHNLNSVFIGPLLWHSSFFPPFSQGFSWNSLSVIKNICLHIGLTYSTVQPSYCTTVGMPAPPTVWSPRRWGFCHRNQLVLGVGWHWGVIVCVSQIRTRLYSQMCFFLQVWLQRKCLNGIIQYGFQSLSHYIWKQLNSSNQQGFNFFCVCIVTAQLCFCCVSVAIFWCIDEVI